MRILLHTEEYLPTALACAIRMDVFASQLRALGHEVTVIAGSNHRNGTPKDRLPDGVIYAPTVKIKKKTAIHRMISNLSFAFTSVFCALGAGKADVVITTSPPPLISISGWIIAAMKRAKLVYDVRDIWPDVALEMGSFSPDSIYCRVFRWITGFMYRKADLITTVSSGKILHLSKLVDPKKLLLVSNGYDLRNDRYFADGTAAQYDISEKFACVYIGNVGLAQGLESLLEIAARTRHTQTEFLIFGDGARREALVQEAAARGLNRVHFCGPLPHDQVASVLTHAKISYIPLKNSNMKDSIPTKLYESLAMGCPVLLAAAGDACEILAECGLGRSVPPEDPDAIVAAFDEMVDQYDLLVQHRDQAKHIIREKHSRQHAVQQLEQALKKLLSSAN